MLNLFLKKINKSRYYKNLDARYWIQMIILNKNYFSSKNKFEYTTIYIKK